MKNINTVSTLFQRQIEMMDKPLHFWLFSLSQHHFCLSRTVLGSVLIQELWVDRFYINLSQTLTAPYLAKLNPILTFLSKMRIVSVSAVCILFVVTCNSCSFLTHCSTWSSGVDSDHSRGHRQHEEAQPQCSKCYSWDRVQRMRKELSAPLLILCTVIIDTDQSSTTNYKLWSECSLSETGLCVSLLACGTTVRSSATLYLAINLIENVCA